MRIEGLLPEERAAGVVAASAGNHAQGVALASSLLGVRSTVFMPTGAALPKVAATRHYGADVRLLGTVVDETLAAAQEYAAETGAVFIHPFDHPDIIAGQGTVGLEILEQCPEVRTIVVGIGGGGLAAGIAIAVKSLRPDVRIVGVQAAGAAAYPPSLAAGRPVSVENPATMARSTRGMHWCNGPSATRASASPTRTSASKRWRGHNGCRRVRCSAPSPARAPA